MVAYFVGDRSEESCRGLWERVPEAHRLGRYYSDFWKAYREVIPEERHEAVDKESGETAHIERWNNTLRQRLSRFVRKSLSFSKSDRMHEICLRLFLHRYNLSRLPCLIHYPELEGLPLKACRWLAQQTDTKQLFF